MRRTILALLLFIPAIAQAAPVTYALQRDRSEVGFTFNLSGVENRGTMPVERAQIIIDTEKFANSSADVTLNVSRARTGLVFATEALKAASVLNAASHPAIRFQSTAIRPNDPQNLSAGAKIDGNLTIRGVTRAVTLEATLFRQAGTAAGDLSQLSFRISGQVNRSDFGATGYSDLVDDSIAIDIAARVIAQP